eukprot:TRINITY_DN2949_c1_g1_i1.p1 TRINITY_DN2949_c1_g1~~TRINITY_DN2949_c1_g1_i1.p1  ORF type:complete len:264 (-),score=57.05 TRINITY_DN2949_c1_g1_i1:113-796(-)
MISLSDFIFAKGICGKNIELLNPHKIRSIGSSHKNSSVAGNYLFRKNSGIYKWTLKVSKLKKERVRLFVKFGVCRLFDVCYCNESTSIFFYGFSSEGRKYLNDGFVGGPGGNTIPDDVNSLIIDLELNTHTCELKTIFYECNGMDVYYEYTINVPVPCYPYFNIDQEDLEIEIINFVRQQLVRSEKEQKEDNIKIELEKDILESDKPLEQDQSKKKLLLKQIKELFG